MILLRDMATQRKKRTAGRPRSVDPTGNSAGHRTIALRVTENQYNTICKRAARDGITVSELVRRVAAA